MVTVDLPQIQIRYELGDFSTISFTMVGLGEPRVVRAGVVGGSFFDVMGCGPCGPPDRRHG